MRIGRINILPLLAINTIKNIFTKSNHEVKRTYMNETDFGFDVNKVKNDQYVIMVISYGYTVII